MIRNIITTILLLLAINLQGQDFGCTDFTLKFDRFVVDYRSPNWCSGNRLAAEFSVTNSSTRSKYISFVTELDECNILQQKDSIYMRCINDTSLKINWIVENGFNEILLYPESTMKFRVIASIQVDSTALDLELMKTISSGGCYFVFSHFLWDVDGSLCTLPYNVDYAETSPLILMNGISRP
jgi:hypothetical protein